MSLLRAFIAVEISPEIRQAIENSTAPLRAALNTSLIRWVPAGNIHLTMKFLGGISPTNVEMLSQMLSVEASQHQVFKMTFEGLGAFPNSRRPRVIWIGIQAPPELEALQHGIEAATATLGYPTDERPFSPHLTIGRVKQKVNATGIQKIRAKLEEVQVGYLGATHVTAVHLFKSDLKPTGAVYTQLFSAPLKNEVSP
jgi:2'-5' RNA ligase